MNTYKNVGGTHEMADGTIVRTGETVTTELDLVAHLPQKFILVPATPVVVTKPKAAPVAPAPKAAPKTNNDAPVDNGMADVTADFDGAAEADLTVMKDKRGWWVYDGTEDAANEKALKKKEVADFIAEYTAD